MWVSGWGGRRVQVFDVLNFDLIVMLRTSFVPCCAEWIFKVSGVHPAGHGAAWRSTGACPRTGLVTEQASDWLHA